MSFTRTAKLVLVVVVVLVIIVAVVVPLTLISFDENEESQEMLNKSKQILKRPEIAGNYGKLDVENVLQMIQEKLRKLFLDLQ